MSRFFARLLTMRPATFLSLSLICCMRVLAAQGPSFDCAAARTPSELLICSDSALAAEELGMAQSYSEVLKQMLPNDQAEFRRQQTAWFREYANSCNSRMTTEDRRGCVSRNLEARTKQLRAMVQPKFSGPAHPTATACTEGALIAGAVAMTGAAIADVMGLAGVASAFTAKVLVGAAITGCLSDAMHDAMRRSREAAQNP